MDAEKAANAMKSKVLPMGLVLAGNVAGEKVTDISVSRLMGGQSQMVQDGARVGIPALVSFATFYFAGKNEKAASFAGGLFLSALENGIDVAQAHLMGGSQGSEVAGVQRPAQLAGAGREEIPMIQNGQGRSWEEDELSPQMASFDHESPFV